MEKGREHSTTGTGANLYDFSIAIYDDQSHVDVLLDHRDGGVRQIGCDAHRSDCICLS